MGYSVYKTTKKKRRGQLIPTLVPRAFPFFFQRRWLAPVLSQDAAVLELNKTGKGKAFFKYKRDEALHLVNNQYGVYVNVAVYTIAVRQPCFNCPNRWFSCCWRFTVHEYAKDAGGTVLTGPQGSVKRKVGYILLLMLHSFASCSGISQ